MFGDNDSQQLQLDVTTVDLGLYTQYYENCCGQPYLLTTPNDDTMIGADNYRGVDDETIGHMF